MAAGHEHALRTQVDMLHTDRASWWLKILGRALQLAWSHDLLFTMLLFNFYYGQLAYRCDVCLIFLSISFCFLFRYAPYHFENVVAGIEA